MSCACRRQRWVAFPFDGESVEGRYVALRRLLRSIRIPMTWTLLSRSRSPPLPPSIRFPLSTAQALLADGQAHTADRLLRQALQQGYDPLGPGTYANACYTQHANMLRGWGTEVRRAGPVLGPAAAAVHARFDRHNFWSKGWKTVAASGPECEKHRRMKPTQAIVRSDILVPLWRRKGESLVCL